MMAWQKIKLPNIKVGDPAPLPPELVGLDEHSLSDLSWVDPALGYEGYGFVWVDDPPAPPTIPDLVPMYKVRKYLIKKGMMEEVNAALEAMSGESGELARVDWEYAPNLVRQSPLVQGIGMALGLTAEQIDEMVLEASEIP